MSKSPQAEFVLLMSPNRWINSSAGGCEGWIFGGPTREALATQVRNGH